MTYIGLDLETSGTDIDAGALPIQLGMANGLASSYSSLIGWEQDDLMAGWSDRSAEVHGIPAQRVTIGKSHSAFAAETIDGWAVEWLTTALDRDIAPNSLVAVGWNVGSFDFPFVKRYLPKLGELFSYRFVDLNAVCFTLAESRRRASMKPDGELGYKSWKKRVKRASEEAMGHGEWHDAGYDAAASLAAWWFLCDRVNA